MDVGDDKHICYTSNATMDMIQCNYQYFSQFMLTKAKKKKLCQELHILIDGSGRALQHTTKYEIFIALNTSNMTISEKIVVFLIWNILTIHK